MMKRPLYRLAAAAAVLSLAAAAYADRPSLLDLQATLDQVVNGLCNGDAATCGLAPVPAAVGSFTLDSGGFGVLSVPLVEAVVVVDVPFVCGGGGCSPQLASFPNVEVTFVGTSDMALLASEMISGGVSTAQVQVTIGGDPLVIDFGSVRLQTIDADEFAGRSTLVFSYDDIDVTWLAQSSGWDLSLNQGSGCIAQSGTRHVELAGNAASNLLVGEIEAVYRLGLDSSSGSSTLPTLSMTRQPPEPCHLRAVASGLSFGVSFERLWSQNDAFPGTRQVEETVDMQTGFINNWELRVASGVLTEKISFVPTAGTLTTRSFDAMGQIGASQSVGF